MISIPEKNKKEEISMDQYDNFNLDKYEAMKNLMNIED